MRKLARIALWLVWIVTVVLTIIPIGYFFAHICDEAFVLGTVGDWFATVIGVVVGIPIALWLNRWQQKEQEQREQSIQKKEALAREVEILRLIWTELKYNHDQIGESTKRDKDGSKPVFRTLRDGLSGGILGKHSELVEGCGSCKAAPFDRLRVLTPNSVRKGAKCGLRQIERFSSKGLEMSYGMLSQMAEK